MDQNEILKSDTMNVSQQFSNLAARFRQATTRKEYDSASQRAGQLVFVAVEAEKLQLPMEYPKPVQYLGKNPNEKINGTGWRG